MRWRRGKGAYKCDKGFLIVKQRIYKTHSVQAAILVCIVVKYKMSAKQFSFRGLMAPVFTPFDVYQKVDYCFIPSYAEYLIKKGIKGVLVNGTTGEGTSLTTNERIGVLKQWISVRFTNDLTVMVQVGGTNLTDVLHLARNAEAQDVDAILCLPDLYFKPSNLDDLISYLQIVSSAAPRTPLLYYHIPAYTGVNLNMKDLMKASVEIPTFVGIKFTDHDLVAGSSLMSENFKDSAVFLGCDRQFLSALQMGFDSAISTTINLFPDLHTNILRLHQLNKMEEAKLEQEKLNRNITEITKYGSWVSSMKGAMNKITGIKVGPVRSPLNNVNFQCVSLNFEEPTDFQL